MWAMQLLRIKQRREKMQFGYKPTTKEFTLTITAQEIIEILASISKLDAIIEKIKSLLGKKDAK